ncbi:MAG: hypothetical protein ACE5NG_20425, partial [bacterium]
SLKSLAAKPPTPAQAVKNIEDVPGLILVIQISNFLKNNNSTYKNTLVVTDFSCCNANHNNVN